MWVLGDQERKRRMLRITITTAALLFASGALLLASGAVAQELTAAQRDACMAD
jgi:hypothetical protein